MQSSAARCAAAPGPLSFSSVTTDRTSVHSKQTLSRSTPSLLRRSPSFKTAHPSSSNCPAKTFSHRRGPVQCNAAKGDDSESEAPLKEAAGKAIDAAGAGLSWVSPEWLTKLVSTFQGPDDSGVPVANAQLNDVQELLGGALFLPLFRWMLETGPVYRLAAGPRNFVIIGEPQAAKHVLRNYGTKYHKGLVAEVSEFLFGSGFAIAEAELWQTRRKAVAPSLHRKYLSTMVDTVFAACSDQLIAKLERVAASGKPINMEAAFSQLTLDVIGKSVFNYDFDSLTSDSPVIQAVYTALKETESRSTDILPYWQVPLLCKLIPRQQKAAAAVKLIQETVERLVAQCKEIVEAENERLTEEEYINESDPSVLRFLLASREEVSSTQLRDDLLSMLVAGHETTGSVLTWTVYLLAQSPSAREKVFEELARVLPDGRSPSFADTRELKYIMRCINESMRLYPHPPVLIRRAIVDDEIPGGYKVKTGQDVMISVYNIHHSPQVWDKAEEFFPERFDLEGQVPNEANTDFRYIPFSGGPRKCVGDQFALLESVVALAKLFQRFDFELVPGQDIGMTTGATIHTKNGLYMTVKDRQKALSKEPVLV
ncbi:cytochrome P450 superfamily protein [Klebsormidium nitens]|uniref:Cytochrome P450 superfamily protein n=1 Tax=Klebsormidium nitens TaxID=105231 RepID=A0A1Y1HWV4_KLENI|nr:cytochrome P450 superfamily protein [Klebsormidium nitens]|eukprot:GAQ83134.1 cytochrome P450 superfamily protein [Klebsormidium nitens]